MKRKSEHRTAFTEGRPFCLAAVLLILIFLQLADVNHAGAALEPAPPRYEITLDFQEFSVLHSAIRSAIDHYGVEAAFQVRMVDEQDGVRWHLTFYNPQMINAVKTWVAEMTTELVRAVDFDNLGSESAATMKVAKSLNNKIAAALANPIWDTVSVTGQVGEENGYYILQTDYGAFRITGEHHSAAGILADKTIIAEGYLKTASEFELLHAHEKRPNTLEVFVMSHCPYSVMAEAALLNHLSDLPAEEAPTVEFRYLFYDSPTTDGQHLWWALHGEEEIRENLVQIVLRDVFPEVQPGYLKLRAVDLERPWPEVAAEAGLTGDEIESIEAQITSERDALIEDEFLYATRTYGLYDGSPSFVWEGERVFDLRRIEALQDIKFTRQNCRK